MARLGPMEVFACETRWVGWHSRGSCVTVVRGTRLRLLAVLSIYTVKTTCDIMHHRLGCSSPTFRCRRTAPDTQRQPDHGRPRLGRRGATGHHDRNRGIPVTIRSTDAHLRSTGRGGFEPHLHGRLASLGAACSLLQIPLSSYSRGSRVGRREKYGPRGI